MTRSSSVGSWLYPLIESWIGCLVQVEDPLEANTNHYLDYTKHHSVVRRNYWLIDLYQMPRGFQDQVYQWTASHRSFL